MSAPRPDFTLDQLLVLEAIDQTGSFAKAARSLNRVPSAVSYAVRTLEGAVGLELFDRSQHRATLTAAGARILEESREVLLRARRLGHIAQTLHDGWAPSLSLVVDGAFPTEPLMRALRRFNQHQAPTRILIHVEYQSGVVARFHRDHTDLMLMLEFDGTGRLEAEALSDLGMCLVAAPDHPLAAGPVDRAALDDHVEIVVRDSAPEFLETPREPWFGSRHVVYLSDFHSKLIGIRAGAGYGWLPDWLADSHLAAGDLCLIDLAEGNRWTYHPHVIWRRDVPLGRAGRAFLDAVRSEVEQFLDEVVHVVALFLTGPVR